MGNIPSLADIRKAVFEIILDSAAGPDSFSIFFYQSCWDFIAQEIFEVARDFFCGTPLPPRNVLATTIALIPIIESPSSWSNFRPISLCNVSNKILTKLLYKKLEKIRPSTISLSQNGFVPGCLIGDNILFAQEMIHSNCKGKVVMKLDMSKAYVRVLWSFLYAV
ncbi:hypothetical protein BUALT_Bualt07G0055500 [Buddleja alternifolia]|uniref:Reverse transcriptase domain-containing protein n=1 Tax=Buddleja alternifolia TaxID=168488 RepID=A0AAV6X890_9LAMI|nr:hypothetical protein BUALT_Bualt07G0055500 [Buddleja alternifolia]